MALQVTDFQYVEDIHFYRKKTGSGKLFHLLRPYTVILVIDGREIEFTAPADMATDLASIPSIVPKWIAQKVDSHIESAVIHDFMCNIRGPWSSKVAAEIFRVGMLKTTFPAYKREYMYRAVLHFGPQWR